MSLRVRCTQCRTAFLTTGTPGQEVECPKCGTRQHLPRPDEPAPPIAKVEPIPAEPSPVTSPESSTVFVPSEQAKARSARRWFVAAGLLLVLLALGTVSFLVLWPRFRPRSNDLVERVAEDYLTAIARDDHEAQRRLSTIDEPPAIRSFQTVRRDAPRNRTVKGSFAPLGKLHARIAGEFTYDPAIHRFTPKNPLGAAGATLDAVQAAKENAEKTGLYDKMASGDPDDIFDAAESFGKVFSQLAEGALAPKKILPTYKMLVDDAKPPLPDDVKELASTVAENPAAWETLLKRPFHTLRADGPYILDRAEVDAQVIDRLGSLGDPPTTLRLSLVRFRLEGIDTGWKVTSASRVIPDEAPHSPGEITSPGSHGDRY